MEKIGDTPAIRTLVVETEAASSLLFVNQACPRS